MEKAGKSCSSSKNMISTSERGAEYPFVGQNTQQVRLNYKNIVIFEVFYLSDKM